jgi:hypothetical protein
MVYTVRDYRIALLKMEGFLAWLPAEQVFHSWNDEPRPEVHARRVARAAGNLELAVRYLRAKLYSISLVEAIAEVTGGDVPVDYFMGGAKTPRPAESSAMKRGEETLARDRIGAAGDGGKAPRRIEQFLPSLPHARDLDPSLHRLLAEGRASESSFDTGPSPLGAFLHATVGDRAVMEGVELAKRWWAGASDPSAFLASQPSQPVAAIARAAGNIVNARRDRLFALAERLER